MPKGKFKARQAAKMQAKGGSAGTDKENPAAAASGSAKTASAATATPAGATPPVPPTAAAAGAGATEVAPPAVPAKGGAGGSGAGGSAPSGGAGGAGGAGATYVDFDASESGKELDPAQVIEELVKGITVTTGTNEKKVHPNAKDIALTNLNLSLFGTELLVDTEMTLNWGNRYGLLGVNGCGKSTLMHMLGRRMVPVPKNIDIYHVIGEIEPGDMSALEAVMAVDRERLELEAEAADLEEKLDDPENGDMYQERVCEIYERLEEMGADTAEARASGILHGLGFTPAMQAKRTRDFSGGWRMRISLARALFLNPSCLLLDEPTNHLDMEAVVWLEGYLAKFSKILLMVSHSQDFLNNVTTHTIHMTEQTLHYYGGNYDSYRITRAEKEEAQMKRYEWEQEQIKHMKEYIARFGHGSAKLAKQAQSKEKTLAKMERSGLVQKVKSDKTVTMTFSDPGTLPPPVLQVQSLDFKYPGTDHWIYKDLEFGMDLDSRVALVGPNGAGKTTLLKLITGELVPNSGNVRPHQHLRFQRYTQHFVDSLDLNMAPLEYMMSLYDDESREKCRSYLGRYGVAGVVQTQKMAYLSDGIKSRVVFALIAKRNPHFLLLDEPTNHLDIETIDSLADGIKEFKGGLLLVSHDMRLISQVANEIWECANGTITPFKGTIEEYKKLLQDKLARVAKELKKKEAAAAAAGKA